MGADNPYHAVRIGGEGFDLPISKGADARLLAAAPELLAENKRYRKTLERIAREDYNQNHYEHTEEKHIWDMMHNMIQIARMALGQDIETGEMSAEEFGAETFEARYNENGTIAYSEEREWLAIGGQSAIYLARVRGKNYYYMNGMIVLIVKNLKTEVLVKPVYGLFKQRTSPMSLATNQEKQDAKYALEMALRSHSGGRRGAEEFGAEDSPLQEWWQQSMDNCVCGNNGCLYCEEINQTYDNDITLSDLKKISQMIGDDCHCDNTYENDVLLCYNCFTKETLKQVEGEEFEAEQYGRMDWAKSINYKDSKRKIKSSPSNYNPVCSHCGEQMAAIGPYVMEDGTTVGNHNRDFFIMWCGNDNCNYGDSGRRNAESFDSEFTQKDISALSKFVNLPPQHITGEMAEKKNRKYQQRLKGMIPTHRGVDSMRRKVIQDAPTIFKVVQYSIIGGFAGLIGYRISKDSKK
jgi:hypothetical protein